MSSLELERVQQSDIQRYDYWFDFISDGCMFGKTLIEISCQKAAFSARWYEQLRLILSYMSWVILSKWCDWALRQLSNHDNQMDCSKVCIDLNGCAVKEYIIRWINDLFCCIFPSIWWSWRYDLKLLIDEPENVKKKQHIPAVMVVLWSKVNCTPLTGAFCKAQMLTSGAIGPFQMPTPSSFSDFSAIKPTSLSYPSRNRKSSLRPQRTKGLSRRSEERGLGNPILKEKEQRRRNKCPVGMAFNAVDLGYRFCRSDRSRYCTPILRLHCVHQFWAEARTLCFVFWTFNIIYSAKGLLVHHELRPKSHALISALESRSLLLIHLIYQIPLLSLVPMATLLRIPHVPLLGH